MPRIRASIRPGTARRAGDARRRTARLAAAAFTGAALLFAGAVAPARAGEKYAAEFLRLGVGARALGMGGGFVAVADDASALYWNPAGLAACARAEMLFMHAEQFGSLANHDFVGFVQPVASADRPASVGIGLIRFAVDDILVTRDAYSDRNQNGRRDEDELILIDRFYTDSDTEYGLLLAYGRQVSDKLALGADAKLIRQGLLDNASFGFGLDLGAILRPTPFWSLGVRLADATTTRVSWDTGRKETLSPSLTLGIGYTRAVRGARGRLTGALSLASTFEHEQSASQVSGGSWGGDVRGGFEYWHADAVAARVGMDAGALTAGAGLRYRSLGVDYAYLAHEELDSTHRVSASVRF